MINLIDNYWHNSNRLHTLLKGFVSHLQQGPEAMTHCSLYLNSPMASQGHWNTSELVVGVSATKKCLNFLLAWFSAFMFFCVPTAWLCERLYYLLVFINRCFSVWFAWRCLVVKAEWTVIYTRYESGASLLQWHIWRKCHILFQIWLAKC